MSTSNDFVAYAYTSTTDRNSCTIYRFTTRWLRSSIQGSTTAILSSSGYQLTCSDVFGLCSTLRFVLCSGFVAGRYDLITDALATL